MNKNWTISAGIGVFKRRLPFARKRARDYRSFDDFRAIAYCIAGDI